MKAAALITALAGVLWWDGCVTDSKTSGGHQASAGGIDPITMAGIEQSNRATQDAAEASNRAANDAANQAAVDAANAAANQAAADAAQAAANAANAQ